MTVRKIFSKISSDVLIASVMNVPGDAKRTDASGPEEILQVSLVSIPQGVSVKGHKHVPIERSTVGTQETWIVVSGEIIADIFDIDDRYLDTVTLVSGSCFTLFHGGHSLKSVTDAVFYEVKNGPYYGPESDRVALS